MPRYILVPSTTSTNTHLASIASTVSNGTVVYTPCQEQGRGQYGNSWESEPNKNIAFSMLLKNPPVKVSQQFRISEAVSMAIVDVLSLYDPEGFTVKWPNDIYYGDDKVCGILIEHSVCANKINHTIVGVGININQREFVSGAPNPISLAQITNTEYDTEVILHQVCERIDWYIAQLEKGGDDSAAVLHNDYLTHLYRMDGSRYYFKKPNGERFLAKIINVDTDGMLTLCHNTEGEQHKYAFKEVAFEIHSKAI